MIAAQWDREFLGRYRARVSRVLSGTRFQADLDLGVDHLAVDVPLVLYDTRDYGITALDAALPRSVFWPLRVVVLWREANLYVSDVYVVMDDDDRLINVRDLLREHTA